MSLNLSKRILTAFFLSIILLTGLFFNKYIWFVLLISASIISFYEFDLLTKKIFKNQNMKIFLINILSFSYLVIFVYVGYQFYNSSFVYLIFSLLIGICSDTGGYIVGNFIGGKKLTKISPNKTISGSVGSFLFSLISIVILISFFEIDLIHKPIIELVFICLFLSLICQLGDLLISFFKRKANVKDTGTILPGHGGLLDRIDGIIFVLPAAFVLDILTS